MNPAKPASNVFKLEPNAPTELTLQNPNGLNVQGQYGPQVMFTLPGNRRLYVPEAVGAEIRALTLAPGQSFLICKRTRAQGQGYNWEVERMPAPAPSTRQNAPEAQGTPTQIEHALKTAVFAACEAERFATEIGYTVRFSEESIRALAITVLIGKQREAA